MRKSVSPSRGAGGLVQALSHGLGQGVGQGFMCVVRYLPTILVCWLSDAFGARFSFFWQTKGHTLIHS